MPFKILLLKKKKKNNPGNHQSSGCVLIQVILFQVPVERACFLWGEGLLTESWSEDTSDTWEGLTQHLLPHWCGAAR